MSELRSVTQLIRSSTRNRSRKTLQVLQVSAHDPNQLVPSPMAKPHNKKDETNVLDTTYKVIPEVENPVDKENVTVRRSKRKNAKESSKEVPAPKSQKQKPVKKSSKSKKFAAKKLDEPDPNQSTLNDFVSSISISIKQEQLAPPELNEPEPSSLSNKDVKSKDKDSEKSIITGTTSYSVAEQIEWMTSENPPPSYWEELAEQRRIALEKTLYENAQLYDQLEVLQAENSQLKSLLKECETVIESVKNSLD